MFTNQFEMFRIYYVHVLKFWHRQLNLFWREGDKYSKNSKRFYTHMEQQNIKKLILLILIRLNKM